VEGGEEEKIGRGEKELEGRRRKKSSVPDPDSFGTVDRDPHTGRQKRPGNKESKGRKENGQLVNRVGIYLFLVSLNYIYKV
jgi:hypothetical protein